MARKQCQVCGQPATVRVEANLNGRHSTMLLCDDHYRQLVRQQKRTVSPLEALFGSQAILAAVHRRHREGVGARIEISLLDALLDGLLAHAHAHGVAGVEDGDDDAPVFSVHEVVEHLPDGRRGYGPARLFHLGHHEPGELGGR